MYGLSKSLTAEACQPIYVVPRGYSDDLTDHDPQISTIYVTPLKGMARVLRDLLFCSHWARASNADLVIIPHEWVPRVEVPIINIIQNILYLHQNPPQKAVKAKAMRWIVRKTMSNATATLSVAATTRDIWANFSGRGSDVLPEGVDAVFSDSATDERENLIVIITGPASYKNPDLSLKVAHQLSLIATDTRIVVVGIQDPGNLRHVQFFPWMQQDDLARLLGVAQLMFFPSKVESFGLPAFEARAAGARAVVFKGTSMAEWLSHDQFVHIIEQTANARQIASEIIALMEGSVKVDVQDDFNWKLVGPSWQTYVMGVAHGHSKRHVHASV